MRLRIAIPLLAFLMMGLNWTPCFGQQQSSEGGRRVISRVIPTYPELARKMDVQGTVRLQVTVAPNGTARFIEPLGGSPVLVKAAQDAVYKWRWAASSETKELVDLHFHPQ
jgi:TonB family protein